MQSCSDLDYLFYDAAATTCIGDILHVKAIIFSIAVFPMAGQRSWVEKCSPTILNSENTVLQQQ